MIETTVIPDERGRVSILPILKMSFWKHGDAVKIGIIETIELKPENSSDKK